MKITRKTNGRYFRYGVDINSLTVVEDPLHHRDVPIQACIIEGTRIPLDTRRTNKKDDDNEGEIQ